MAIVHSDNLDIFNKIPVDTSVENIEYIQFRPVNPITRQTVIEFNIPGNGLPYIDLSKTTLYVKVAILKKDGSRVNENDDVAFVNLPLASLFSQCAISLNQVEISANSSNSYGYRGLMQTVLYYSEDAKESWLHGQLYYKDTPGFMHATAIDGGNFGCGMRYEWTKRGNAVDLMGPLFCDVMDIQKLLIPGVDINIKLYPSVDAFALLSPSADYMYNIESAHVSICSVKLNSQVVSAQNEVLRTTPAVYNFKKSDIKAFTIPSGILNWSMDDIFLGRIPESVTIALTESDAFYGNVTKNPFNFKHMNVNQIGMEINGQSQPSVPLRPDFENRNYVEAYLSLFQGTNKFKKDIGNYISRDEYDAGYTMYMFNLNKSNNDHYRIASKQGHTRLNIQFAKPLPTTATIIVHATFNARIEIDNTRNVVVKE